MLYSTSGRNASILNPALTFDVWLHHDICLYAYIIINCYLFSPLYFIQCSDIHNFDTELQCEFVQNVTSCGGEDGFIPYFEFAYCLLPIKLLPLSLIILVSCCTINIMHIFNTLGFLAILSFYISWNNCRGIVCIQFV